MSWRYQPVWVYHEKTDLTSFTVCEVYLDKDGKLEEWTAASTVTPLGHTIGDLQNSLALMTDAVLKWEPVEFHALEVGMTFKPAE